MGYLYHTLSSKAQGSLFKRWQKNVYEPEEVDAHKETEFSRQRRIAVQMSSAVVTDGQDLHELKLGRIPAQRKAGGYEVSLS